MGTPFRSPCLSSPVTAKLPPLNLHELLNGCLLSGNVDDRHPAPAFLESLWDKLFADKGYLAQWLTDLLAKHDLHLVTKLKKNMRAKLSDALPESTDRPALAMSRARK